MRRWLPFLILLCCSCERRPAAWQRDLASEDPFDRFLAAVALAEGEEQVPGRAVGELVRVTQGPDRRMRETATRVLGAYPDHAVRIFFTLLDRKPQPGQESVKWTGSEFEHTLLERISPALNHPECTKHTRFCDFVGNLSERKRRELHRLNRERQRAQAGK